MCVRGYDSSKKAERSVKTNRRGLASCTSQWSQRTPKEAFAAAMQSRRRRYEKCVRLQGDYVEK